MSSCAATPWLGYGPTARSVRWWSGDGSFKRPSDYPQQALAMVTTHDMPPIAANAHGLPPAEVTAQGLPPDQGAVASVARQLGIDPTGHAEPGSVRVVSASHAAFIEPAREAILGGVYRPARNRGIVVRQLVRQRVVFS